MHRVLKRLLDRARTVKAKRIVYSEGEDPRIIEAALRLAADGIARPLLIGSRKALERQVRSKGHCKVEILDPQESGRADQYVETLLSLRKHKGMTEEQAVQDVKKPLILSYLLLHQGYVDGAVSGAQWPTADVIRGALQLIGTRRNHRIASSAFLMLLDEDHPLAQKEFLFADCALNVDPDAEQLAEIASATARSTQKLLDQSARIAMLSFSSHGSAVHDESRKVVEATTILRSLHPDLAVDGEVQLDAAIVPGVAAQKLIDSQLSGSANTLIFPNLNAGNIGYKIAQRMGGAQAIGPFLQGLNKPANDLSRGCSIDDIYRVSAVTLLQQDQPTGDVV